MFNPHFSPKLRSYYLVHSNTHASGQGLRAPGQGLRFNTQGSGMALTFNTVASGQPQNRHIFTQSQVGPKSRLKCNLPSGGQQIVEVPPFDDPEPRVTEFPGERIVGNLWKIHSGIENLKNNAWVGSERLFIANEILQMVRATDQIIPNSIAPAEKIPEDLTEWFQGALSKDKWSDVLSIGRRVCLDSQQIIGDLPLVEPSVEGLQLWDECLRRLDRARKSRFQWDKDKYIEWCSINIMPRLNYDIVFFQAVSFLLSYVHMSRGVSIPFAPKTYGFIESSHPALGGNTKELTFDAAYMQTGGDYAGIRMRLWFGKTEQGANSGLFMVDCMGTNSHSPDCDKLMGKYKISTGALADADPSGIAHTAFNQALPDIKRLILKHLPKDAVIVLCGHSLGATVAYRLDLLFWELGYSDVHLIGFNGGAFDASKLPIGSRDLRKRSLFLLNKGDYVHKGDSYMPPGEHRFYDSLIDTTIATSQWNPFFGKSRDLLNHGNPIALVHYLVGIPTVHKPRYVEQLEGGLERRIDDLLKYFIPNSRQWLINSALNPRPNEAERKKYSRIISEPPEKK